MKTLIPGLILFLIVNITIAQTKIGHRPGPDPSQTNGENWINYNAHLKNVGEFLSQQSKNCHRLESGYKLSSKLIKEADKLNLLLATKKDSNTEECKETQFLACLTKDITKDGEIYKSLQHLTTSIPAPLDPDKVCDLTSEERQVINKLATDLLKLIDAR